MKKLKRGLCLLMAMILIVPVNGCGKDKKDGDTSSYTSPLEQMSADEMKNYVYKEERISFLDGKDYSEIVLAGDEILYAIRYEYEDQYVPEEEAFEEAISSAKPINETEEAEKNEAEASETDETAEDVETETGVEAEDDVDAEADADAENDSEADEEVTYKQMIDCYDMSGKLLGSVTNEYPQSSSTWLYHTDKNGNLYFLFDDYEYDGLNGAYSEEYSLIGVNQEGKNIFSTVIGTGNDDNYFYVNNFFADDDGIKVVTNTDIITVDFTGKISETKSLAEEEYYNIGNVIKMKNGDYIAMIYGDTEVKLCNMDIKNGTFSEPIEAPYGVVNNTIYEGGEHDILVSAQDGLYYYDIGSEEEVKFLDYVASDMAATGFSYIYICDDNSLIGVYYEETTGTNVVKLTKVDPKDVPDRVTVTLGGIWLDSSIRKKAVDFNKESDKIKIMLVDYSVVGVDFETEFSEMVNHLNTDIVSGNAPDIILVNQDMKYSSYVSKGVFEDLNSLLEKDNEIRKEDLLPNVLEATTVDGKLYGIMSNFYISTLFAKEASLNGKTSWNMSEFMDFINSHPEAEYPMGVMSKADFVQSMMWSSQNEYVDWENGKVYFDSPEFVQLLKYTERLPKEVDYGSDAMNDYWNTYETAYREGRSLLYNYSISNAKDYSYLEQVTFGERVVPIGFPSSKGYGNTIASDSIITISSKSDNKAAAWEFVKVLLKDSEQTGYGFSVNKATFERQLKEAMERPYYLDGGKKVYYDDTYYLGGQELIVEPITPERLEYVRNFVTSVNKKGGTDQAISSIVMEEVAPYLEGQKSAEEVAKVIQSRVQIYVNENR